MTEAADKEKAREADREQRRKEVENLRAEMKEIEASYLGQAKSHEKRAEECAVSWEGKGRGGEGKGGERRIEGGGWRGGTEGEEDDYKLEREGYAVRSFLSFHSRSFDMLSRS